MLIWPASQTFYHISCDILGPLPVSKGRKYIFMIGDNFSRWFEAILLQDIKANTVCDALIDAWITRFGVPEYIHSDNCVQFTSKLYRDICHKLGMEPTYSTLYHSQGNAKVERINRTIEDGLAKYYDENQTQWSGLLQGFMMAYRSTVHESTGGTPFRVSFGQEMRMLIDFLYPTSTDFRSPQNFQSAIQDKLVHNSQLFQYVRSKCALEHHRQKLIFDTKIYGPSYKEQDLVLVHSPVVKTGQSTKFISHWSGPYVIRKKINDVNYIVQNSNNGKKSIVLYDRIKHYNNSFKEKRILLPKRTHSDKQVAFSKKKTEQPRVEDVEIQSDDNDLLLFEPDEGSNQVQQPQPRNSNRYLLRRRATEMARSPEFYYLPWCLGRENTCYLWRHLQCLCQQREHWLDTTLSKIYQQRYIHWCLPTGVHLIS